MLFWLFATVYSFGWEFVVLFVFGILRGIVEEPGVSLVVWGVAPIVVVLLLMITLFLV